MTVWKVREVAAGEFKAKCLQLMDEVKDKSIELVITKRGVPVAKLVPIQERKDSPFGWMKGTFRIVGNIVDSDPSEWEDEDTSEDPL